MDSDDMRRGILPGLISGYFFLAYAEPVLVESSGGIFGANTLTGFVLHTIVSMVVGSLYTGVFCQYLHLGSNLANIVVGGPIYGVIWWLVGINVIVPVLAGDSILQLSVGPLFFGHIIFGHVLAFLVILRDAVMGFGYESLPRLKHPAGYNYNIFDRNTGLTKIGRTMRPKERLRELQSQYGKELRYSSLRESDNAPKEESRSHKKYAARRKDGEWFDMN